MSVISDAEKEQAKADIVGTIGRRIRLVRNGNIHQAPCPFHNEKTPSFSVFPDSGTFHCFGCGAQGDAIDFVMRHDNLTFTEAVYAMTGGDTAAKFSAPASTPTKPRVDDAERTAKAKKAWDKGEEITTANIGGRYFQFTRGLPPEYFHFLKDIARFLPKCYLWGKDVICPAVIFKATDENGNFLGFQAIRLNEDGTKACGDNRRSYGPIKAAAVRIPGTGETIIGDGPDKIIVAALLSGRPGIATLGSFTRAPTFIPQGAASICLSQDHDKPGTDAARLFAEVADACAAITAVFVATPERDPKNPLTKFDWDDIARLHGTEAVRRQLVDSRRAWTPPPPPPAPEPEPETPPPAPPPAGKTPWQKRPKPVPTFDHAPSFPQPTLTLAEGEKLLLETVTSFSADCRTYHGWNGDKGELSTITIEKDGETTTKYVFIPYMVRGTPAIGKTEAIAKIIDAAPEDANINIYCADNTLVWETTLRLRSLCPTRTILPIFGRTGTDPETKRPMCRFAEIAEKIQSFGKNVENHLCKRRLDPNSDTFEYCADHPENPDACAACPYQTAKMNKQPAVRVAAHQYIGIKRGNPLPTADISIIDENSISSLIHDDYKISTISFLEYERPPVYDEFFGDNYAEYAKDKKTAEIQHDKLKEFFHQEIYQWTPAGLRGAGFTADKAKFMATAWYQSIPDLDITPGMDDAEKHEILKGFDAGLCFKMARLWRLIASNVDRKIDALECFVKQGKQLYMYWSDEIEIDGPLIIMDGTANLRIYGRFFPEIKWIDIDIEHTKDQAHVIQVVDRAVSRTMLAYGLGKTLKDPDIKEIRRSTRNRAKLAIAAEVYATRGFYPAPEDSPRLALFTYKPAAEAIRSEHEQLEALGIDIGYPRSDEKGHAGHFGAGRGYDRLKNCPVAIIAGRNLIPVTAAEDKARALFAGTDHIFALSQDGKYTSEQRYIRLRSGESVEVTNESHIDELVREVVVSDLCADSEQLIHRLRLIRRLKDRAGNDIANKALVIIASNHCLNITVDEIVTWDELLPTYADLMIARGVVPEDWNGRAAVVKDLMECYCAVNKEGKPIPRKSPAASLRTHADEQPEKWARLCQDSLYETIIGNPDKLGHDEATTWTRYRYRVAGSRQGSFAWISNLYGSNPAYALRDLGVLSEFAPADAPRARPRPATTAAATPAQVEPQAQTQAAPPAPETDSKISEAVKSTTARKAVEIEHDEYYNNTIGDPGYWEENPDDLCDREPWYE